MTKYAIFVPSDQTIVYLASEGFLTTDHTEALLFNDAYLARTMASEALLDEDGVHVETVTDEKEFRARPKTW